MHVQGLREVWRRYVVAAGGHFRRKLHSLGVRRRLRLRDGALVSASTCVHSWVTVSGR